MKAVKDMTKETLKSDRFGVFRAINAVQRDLLDAGGIGKNQRNNQQKYAFRGIDDVLNAISPALVKNSLVIMPEVLDRTVKETQSRNGGCLFYVTVRVRYTLICADDGSSHSVTVYGEAMDSGDKATNKAMSAAYKYMAIQSFAISTEGDNDADFTTHDPRYQKDQPKTIDGEKIAKLTNMLDRKGMTPQQMAEIWNLSNISDLYVETFQEAMNWINAHPDKKPRNISNVQPMPTRGRMEDGPTPEQYNAAAEQDRARAESPVINPQQYKAIMQLLHQYDISEQNFCQSFYIQSVGLLKQFDFENAVERINARGRAKQRREMDYASV